jgi:hypothetical protein
LPSPDCSPPWGTRPTVHYETACHGFESCPGSATLIGADGASRALPRGSIKPNNYYLYVLGRYAKDVNNASAEVELKFTKSGKKIIKTMGLMNLQLSKKDKKAVELGATYAEAIQPDDGRGTGGAWSTVEIR